ncbi:1-deoxy-D-xylulose-5-phosphate synthase [gamma proteobacterium HdN1]|nr:1-deoxy-D-xylulose-5-phosphate synthase [gamma proteobacterium HdN1]
MMFNELPLIRPATPLLDQIDSPARLRALSEDSLPQLADEMRQYLLYSVGKTGGHFSSGLGVIELTIALHYVYNTPNDQLIWDVGHQAYPHKLLTGRREALLSIRQRHGLAGFPKRDESPFDAFGVGHSSTSISAALGMSIALAMQKREDQVVAIIGDGAITAGMAFEALNHAGHTHSNMLVVLNDNDMSISENVGGLSHYFSRIWASRTYNSLREGGKKVLENLPTARELAKRTEEHMKGMVSPGSLFEAVGFNYIGPIDGHDLPRLITHLNRIKDLSGPQLLHIKTQKGHGFAPAEHDPIGWHALSKIDPQNTLKSAPAKPSRPKYSDIFGQFLCDMAEHDPKLIGITPAMREGSGMVEFSRRFPSQYQDVAIAEQHAVTLAAGMACEGMKPVVAIYSTFLQRAYDQLIHDVALQNLDVLFGIDRSGIVGEDGPTHAGVFDLSFLRCIPNLIVMAPSDENECRQLLYTGYNYNGPAAVRYPRGTGPGTTIETTMTALPIGKGAIRREGQHTAILCFGAPLTACRTVAENLNATLVDMRFVKPLDEALILKMAEQHELLVTVEENTTRGGAGSAINEFLAEQGIVQPLLNLGVPDQFIEHGKPAEMLKECGLDAEGIEKAIRLRLAKIAERASAIRNVV